MPRRPRIDLPGLPHHVVQRGNNRADCFFSDDDRRYYLHLLREACERHETVLHAYVLMTNHVHLLLTPNAPGAMARTLRDVGRDYAQTFNRRNGRSGAFWEGRYKSCLVESDAYVLCAMRYIELNPVRAGMVERPADYAWSSHRANAYGGASPLLEPVASYTGLGTTPADCARVYRSMFCARPSGTEIDALRAHTMQGVPWGSASLRAVLQAQLASCMALRRVGRPARSSE